MGRAVSDVALVKSLSKYKTVGRGVCDTALVKPLSRHGPVVGMAACKMVSVHVTGIWRVVCGAALV